MKVGEMETSDDGNGRRKERNHRKGRGTGGIKGKEEGEAKRLKQGSNGVKFIIGNHMT